MTESAPSVPSAFAAPLRFSTGWTPISRESGACSTLARSGSEGNWPTPGLDDRLSPRELEALVPIAQGQTNGEIAQATFISPRTTANHVSNILARLELGCRTAAVAPVTTLPGRRWIVPGTRAGLGVVTDGRQVSRSCERR